MYSHAWQHGGVSLPPRGVAAGEGVGGGQEDSDKLRVFFFNQWKHITFNVFPCLLFSDSETPSESLWLWLLPAVSLISLFSPYIYTYTYIYWVLMYMKHIYSTLYFLVLTKPVPAQVPVTASFTARSRQDETQNGQQNANWNPEWWEDFSQLHIQMKPKYQFEFVPRDTEEFELNQNLNSNLYREIPRNLRLSTWLVD